MNKILGKLTLYWAKFLDLLFGGVEGLLEIIVNSTDTIKALILPVLVLGVIGMLMFPPLLLLMLTSFGITLIIIVAAVFTISSLGRAGLISFRRYKFAKLNYLYDLARYKTEGGRENESFQFYQNQYDRIQREKFEEELRQEEARRRQRQKAQEEQWRKFFEENFRNANGNYTGGGSYGGYQGNRGGYNPFSNFKQEYQQACDVLGVPYSADYPTIKSAYRQLAKKYHPDLSKEKNAEEMFKKINNAFDLLSEENVARYKNM